MENKEFDFHEIKTFEDACRHLGISKDTQLLMTHIGNTEAFLQANALYKLLIIQKAINNGDFSDKNRYRFYPFWRLYKEEWIAELNQSQRQVNGIRRIASYTKNLYTCISGACIMKSLYVGTYLNTSHVYAFCFNSEEAARYAAKQFESIFFQYYGIKVKE